MAKLYKITGLIGESIHGGSGLWALPTKGKPGKWMPKIANVEACVAGYHLVRAIGIVELLPRAPQAGILWEAEGRGASDAEGTKTAFAQARLIKQIGVLDEVSMRLAAADMAERVLPIFYKVRPKDDRPAKAIKAARNFALGKIGVEARHAARAAAGDAAEAAAWAAAGDAAEAAARAAAEAAAEAAAWAAAEAAAEAAAWAAAGAAAWAANARIIIKQARARLKSMG